MSKKKQEMLVEADELIAELAESIIPTFEALQGSIDHAVLVIGVKYNDDDPDNPNCETLFVGGGMNGVMEEGLYQELKAQIEAGDRSIFNVLKNVVLDISEDLNIDLEDDGPENEQGSFHVSKGLH